jgi:hypothetical protein
MTIHWLFPDSKPRYVLSVAKSLQTDHGGYETDNGQLIADS